VCKGLLIARISLTIPETSLIILGTNSIILGTDLSTLCINLVITGTAVVYLWTGWGFTVSSLTSFVTGEHDPCTINPFILYDISFFCLFHSKKILGPHSQRFIFSITYECSKEAGVLSL